MSVMLIIGQYPVIRNHILFRINRCMNKYCPDCKQDKSLDEFAFKNKSKGTRQCYCHECRRVRAKVTYKKHKKSTIAAVTKRNKAFVERFKELKATYSCKICGESELVCLDFHHLDPSKKDFEISANIHRRGWKVLMQEIDKCVPLCANCHRKVHAGIISIT